ncbi:MAG: L-serine ammonia-lyase, iron-sulfur-dependent, subunit alpha [Eubacteriales bacterium]
MGLTIRNANDALAICEKNGWRLFETALAYEAAKGAKSKEAVFSRMEKNFAAMQDSIQTGLKGIEQGACKMFRDDAKRLMAYREKKMTLSGQTMTKAAAYALAVMEVNCSMGRIVAAPTAGSCGVLPAVILSSMETLQKGKTEGINALLTAGLVGVIIGKNASLSGAEGGCQAEIGSAAAMSAAAIVEMAGGTPKQSFDAAAIALKSMLGLVCDPVAGLVEVPCAKRNSTGAAIALVSADMALSGIPSVIPFDEVVTAMYKVGRAMPGALRETAEGGVAATPTGRRLKQQIFGE